MRGASQGHMPASTESSAPALAMSSPGNEAAPSGAIDLSGLATAAFDQIDVRKRQGLPSLIETALKPVSLRGGQRSSSSRRKNRPEALEAGERLIPDHLDIRQLEKLVRHDRAEAP